MTGLCSTYWKSTTFNICAKISIAIVSRAPSIFPWTHTHPSQGCAMNEDIFPSEDKPKPLYYHFTHLREINMCAHLCTHTHTLNLTQDSLVILLVFHDTFLARCTSRLGHAFFSSSSWHLPIFQNSLVKSVSSCKVSFHTLCSLSDS